MNIDRVFLILEIPNLFNLAPYSVCRKYEAQKLVVELEDKLKYVLRNFNKAGRISVDFLNSCFTSGSMLGYYKM